MGGPWADYLLNHRSCSKDKVDECMKILNSTEVTAPIKRGQLIIENILGLEVDVVAARKAK